VQVFYNGGLNSFEVLPNGENYRIAADGHIIAELKHGTTWQQVEGKPLPKQVLVSIYQEIDQKKS